MTLIEMQSYLYWLFDIDKLLPLQWLHFSVRLPPVPLLCIHKLSTSLSLPLYALQSMLPYRLTSPYLQMCSWRTSPFRWISLSLVMITTSRSALTRHGSHGVERIAEPAQPVGLRIGPKLVELPQDTGRPSRLEMCIKPSFHYIKRALWFGVIGSYIKWYDGLQGEALKVYRIICTYHKYIWYQMSLELNSW